MKTWHRPIITLITEVELSQIISNARSYYCPLGFFR